MLAQNLVEYGVLSAFGERVQTARSEMSAWVSSVGSQELLMVGGAVLVGLLGFRLVLRRR